VKRVAAVVVLVAFGLAGKVSAQASGVGAGPNPAAGRPGAERARDEAHKYVEAYFISNLQERLELTSEQFAKLLPAVMRLQSERRELQQRRMRATQELRRMLESGKATESAVAESLKELKRVESEGPATVWKKQEAVDAQLSVLQQAKFRILETEVERKVRELLLGARRQGAPLRRGERRAPGVQ
jgi:hypothetical protein